MLGEFNPLAKMVCASASGTAIDAALESFWLERARTAPPAESLDRHLSEQEEYLAATRQRFKGGP